jgi:catechol 2,3-dioxygenase-like lactoylglutathione lyase family enzyme
MEPTVMTTPLGAARTVTKIPAQNLDRARRFHRDRLGLEPVEERTGSLPYLCGTHLRVIGRGFGPLDTDGV